MTNNPIPPYPTQSPIDQKRRFSHQQRVALFVAAGGHCSSCGDLLSQGWHADHVDPFSRGGDTDVLNGQALCARCNLKKGNRVIDLRKWQGTGVRVYDQKKAQDFCCSATPGAGKTKFALELARRELASGRVNRIVVVVPTTHLKTQWCAEAAAFGIPLDPDLSNTRVSGETSDFRGCCVTYSQVAMQPDLHRTFCQTPTMVIFDEIHHAGEKRQWGDALRHAFEHATKRLALTGTPFREDGRPIPFVDYGPDGSLKIDVSYSYGDALKDGAVRSIVFPSFEGNMSWWSGDGEDENGTEWSATFADDIPLRQEPRRIRTALDPQGEWMRDVIRQADARLTEIRRSTFDSAAGLIVAIDQQHARAIARTLQEITGSIPVVVISEDADSSRKIAEFRKGGASAPRWIIAVKMVSEGVDIPRLFVGIWATNTKTELFFLQVVGRFVRMIPDLEDQTGYLFIPKLDYLIGFVEAIKKERDITLGSFEDEIEDDSDGPSLTRPSEPADWAPYTSAAIEDATYIGDERFSATDMSEVRKFIFASGLEGTNPEVVALIFRRTLAYVNGTAPAATPVSVTPPPTTMVHEQRDQLKRKVRNLVSRYIQVRADAGIATDQKSVFYELKCHQNGTAQADATLDQLKERISLLTRRIDEVPSGRR